MKKNISKLLMGLYVVGTILFATACNDELEIRQVYPFTVTTMPVQKSIRVGETTEIRCQLHREGHYIETEYFIRYFQPDGKGTLKMSDGTVFKPNDLYPLPAETFRLYYTSASTDQQKIDVYVEDNSGQITEFSLSFNNENEEKEK